MSTRRSKQQPSISLVKNRAATWPQGWPTDTRAVLPALSRQPMCTKLRKFSDWGAGVQAPGRLSHDPAAPPRRIRAAVHFFEGGADLVLQRYRRR